ncbi:hypothetical protein [Vibrio vulnificus]|uniref:hypothetical protein n=1 Tax=Vibrio vulnificus TaxID=672 RepID=UPI003EDAD158
MNNLNHELTPLHTGYLVKVPGAEESNFDTADYIPSIQLTDELQSSLDTAVNTMNGMVSLFHAWKTGKATCQWTVMHEMTFRAKVLSSQGKSIAAMCTKDRSGMIYNPLPKTLGICLDDGLSHSENEELKERLSGVSPSYLLQLLRCDREGSKS